MKRRRPSWVGWAMALGAMAAWGCSDTGGGSSLATGGGASSSSSGSSSGTTTSDGGFSPGTGGTGTGGAGGMSGQCDGLIPATIRDFSSAHPDFEAYSGSSAFTGIVETTLGADGKPVYAHTGSTPQTTGPNEFAQWYNDVPGVNQSIGVALQLIESSPGHFTYDNGAFFPIDGQGFGNEGNPHNYHFTTEIHTTFRYEGGEVFTFTGDDDLWMFINDQLAIDLGGLHPQLSQTLDLDAAASGLGITVGGTYSMAIFHAERHTTESNFRIQTTIACFQPPPS